jgi:hypothetical protein
MIHFTTISTLKALKLNLKKYQIITLVDTRSAKFGGSYNGTSLTKICEANQTKYIGADKLSEQTPPDINIDSAIESLITLNQQGNVLVVGGIEPLQVNHLAYRVVHELHNFKEPSHFILDNNLLVSHTKIIKTVPYGGLFHNMQSVSLNVDEGKYLCHLLDGIGKARLSKYHLLRDFLYSSEASVTGIPNYPEHPLRVIESGKVLCAKVLTPVLDKFGPSTITYGYQNRSGMEHTFTPKQKESKTSSSPHQWDRGTFGHKVYARVDILPYAVESGEITKDEFGEWLMDNLDIDLLMQWRKSNVFCITISPNPRRVWVEWVPTGKGDNASNSITKRGENYWLNQFPQLSEQDKPRYYPSSTNGKMWWGK